MGKEVIILRAIEQLMKFANEKGLVEILIRGKDGKIMEVLKVTAESLPKDHAAVQQIASKRMNSLGSADPIMGAMNLAGNAVNTAIGMKTLKMLGTITKLNYFNILLTGANLCATCAGFAVMFKKLDKMSSKINEVLSVVKAAHQIQINYEFKKVLSEHSNMLDCKRLLKPYSEEEMRKLVDEEYNVLSMLIEAFNEGTTGDKETLIFSIYSLAAMLNASIRYFDEIYYFNNKETITDGQMWHSSHDTWMTAFERITDKNFVAKIQDHGIFDLELNTTETDYYYKSLLNQVINAKQEIEDNQTLLKAFDTQEEFKKYLELLNQDIRENVIRLFDEAGISTEDEDISAALNDAFLKLAVA